MSVFTDYNRRLLAVIHDQVRPHLKGVPVMKAAWVYDAGTQWEFHGPDEFYWHGRAEDAYHARAQGWQAWIRSKRIVDPETGAKTLELLESLVGTIKTMDGPGAEDGLYDPFLVEAETLIKEARE